MGISALEKMKELLWPSTGPTGSPVYLQENGELIGHVTRLVKDDKGKIASYIIDSYGVEMRFPGENITEVDGGLIYQPVWYTHSKKILERLGAQEALNSDLVTAINSGDTPYATIKKRIDGKGGDLGNTIDEAIKSTRLLLEKKRSLEEQKDDLRERMRDLAGSRVLGWADRREFAKAIIEVKRNAQIVESNLDKLNELLEGFSRSPFIDIGLIENTKKEMVSIETSEDVNPTVSRRREAGERIKKIRILKLEKNLADKQKQVAETYVKERLKDINIEVKELTQMVEENKDNEKLIKFLNGKLDRLDKEKKQLQVKLKRVKSTTSEAIRQSTQDDMPEINGITGGNGIFESTPPNAKGINASLLSRVGTLVIIGGLILILVLSLMGVL